MHWGRLAIVATGIIVLGCMAWQLREHGPGGVPILPGCHFRKWTGLDCPGCGMTRAAAAALNGHVVEAFKFNPLGIILLPIAVIGLMPGIFNWVARKPVAWRLRPSPIVTWLILSSIILFWIVRNQPWWPLR